MREFVQYLNTLHRLNGSNINTTAEAGLNNKYASSILYKDEELTSQIIEKLLNNGKVLLTGYAGDGKTTLAKFVADQLSGYDVDFTNSIIRFTSNENEYVIIKDLSEISDNNAAELLFNELNNKDKSILIVSNTGSIRTKLLTSFDNGYWKGSFDNSRADFESLILKGIECGENRYTEKLCLGDVIIHTFNLVKHDNLNSAKIVLKKILDNEEWNNADEEEKQSIVYLNVQLMKENNYLAVERMFYIYRKMYEYGVRLTMRNLLEHFSYIITGNRTDYDRSYTNYLFFDNFFGVFDSNASEIKAIECLRRFNFGDDIPGNWKRRICCGVDSEHLKISVPSSMAKIDRYKGLFTEDAYLSCYYSLEDQGSIIRSIFFLNDSSDIEFKKFISEFCGSPAFWFFWEIQENRGVISRPTVKKLNRILKRVLRDFCSGLRIPADETDAGDSIYITMARKSKQVDQSTQIVLGEFIWNRNTVGIDTTKDSRGIYHYVIKLKNKNVEDSCLIINLPLMDYLSYIDEGLPLKDVDSLFQKRLENIKLVLLNATANMEEDIISVVYKDIHNRVHPIRYVIDNKKIYVE